MSYSPPPSPPASAPPPLAPPLPPDNNGIPIISLITPPSSPVRAIGPAEPGSTSPQEQTPSPPSSPGTEQRPAALAGSQPRQPGLEYPSTRATRRRADREAARWARFVAADARRIRSAIFVPVKPTYEGKGKGRAKAVGGASVGDVAGASASALARAVSVGGGLAGGHSRKKNEKAPARVGGWARAGISKLRPSKGGSSAGARDGASNSPSPDERDGPTCDFCPVVNRNGGTLPSPILGPFTKGSMRKNIYVHHICAMWAPEVFHDPDTNELTNVIAAYHRSRGLECTVCLAKGATVGCYVDSCRRVYHFFCLYGRPPTSLSHPENNGPCTRHDEYFAAFCPAHSANANDEVYMKRMKADAELSTFLSERSSAVEAALDGDPGLGMDCPGFDVTGIRRNETETIFCWVWRVASVLPTDSWVTVVGRQQRRVLSRGERLAVRDLPRRVPRSALGLFGAPDSVAPGATSSCPAATATPGDGQGGATGAKSAGDRVPSPADGDAPDAPQGGPSGGWDAPADLVAVVEGAAAAPVERPASGRRRVFLMRNLRQCRALGRRVLRPSLPAVPSSYLHTTVVMPASTRPQSLPAGTSSGGGPAQGSTAGRAVGGSALSGAGSGGAGGGVVGGTPQWATVRGEELTPGDISGTAARGSGARVPGLGQRPIPAPCVPPTCRPDSAAGGEHAGVDNAGGEHARGERDHDRID